MDKKKSTVFGVVAGCETGYWSMSEMKILLSTFRINSVTLIIDHTDN